MNDTCVCCGCGSTFTRKPCTKGLYCSVRCAASANAKNRVTFTPPSTLKERAVAQRAARAALKASPTLTARSRKCQRCGEWGWNEMHHVDYAQPTLVLFLCVACHRRAHHKPHTVSALKPVQLLG
jgi:hypothetical protein